jgi:ribosomal protein S18 acetylase RimI-like enzyme
MEPARSAKPDDLPVLVELARAFRAELVAQRGGPLWAARDARTEPLQPAFAALVDRADAEIAVGTIDGSIVGFGTVEIETLRDGTKLGIVGELYVEPEAREVGVGESIADHLVAYCTACGCAGIDAVALPGARAAKNFFERSGFTARAIVMHRKL